MLVYEKKVDDVRHIFGTLGNVPADDDVQLTYEDQYGDAIVPTLNDTYLDDGHGGIIQKSTGDEVIVSISDTVIIPAAGFTPEPKVLDSIVLSGTYKTTYADGETLDLTGLVVTAKYEEGADEVVTDYTTAPASGATLTTTDTSVTVTYQTKTASYSITVS